MWQNFSVFPFAIAYICCVYKMNKEALILICFLFAAVGQSNANADSNIVNGTHQVYINFGAAYGGPANFPGIGMGYTHPSGWGGSFGMRSIHTRSINLPADFLSGLCLSGSCRPKDYQYIFTLSLVKQFYTKTPYLSFAVEGGPALVNNYIIQYAPNSNGGLFNSNYTTWARRDQTIGLSLRPKLLFDYASFGGLEAALFFHINTYQTWYGAELYLRFGQLRRKVKAG